MIQKSVRGSAIQTMVFDFGYLFAYDLVCGILGMAVSNRGLRME